MGRDPDYDPAAEMVYECLDCGDRLLTAGAPGSCPECGAPLRNVGMPLE